MSYRCAISGKVVPAGQSAIRMVVAIRPATHPSRDKAIRKRIPGKKKKSLSRDPGGQGTQIAREVLVCREVADRLRNQPPEVWPERPPRKRLLDRIDEAIYGVDED